MRILQLCPKVPWPADDGGRVAMRMLALSLRAAGASVRTLSLNPAKHRADLTALPEEARTLRLEAVDVDTSVTVGGALRSLLFGGSYNVERFLSGAFERRLLEVVREEPPDVVLLESLFMVPYLPALRSATRAPVVLRSHNVEHRIWEGLARVERAGAKRFYLQHLSNRLREYEAATVNDLDAVLPVTREDADDYRQLGARIPVHVSPVGIATSECPDRSGQGDPLTLVFLGSLDWTPNLDAVRWFLESAWPLVRRAVPGARFHVGGSNPPRGLEGAFRVEGARFLGRVTDAREFLASGAAMVVPLLAGGGVRVKILEAMALGVPVVSTRLGATGIDACDGEEILLADGPDLLAGACAALLADRNRAVSIGRAGRRRVTTFFDANEIGRDLLGFLAGIPSRAPASPVID